MASYGISLYGFSFYGISSLPVSDPWDIFDFCEPTDASMLTIMAHPESSSSRLFVAPYFTFNGSNDLCLYSNDDANSGISIELSIPPTFSMQFTILPSAIPDDFSSLSNERLFVAAHNQFGKMIGLLLSENGGLALSQDGSGTGYQHIIDSADLFTAGSQYYTFRVTINGTTGSSNIYVTPTVMIPVIGHQLKVTTQALDTLAGTPDGVVIEAYGSAANPTTVCFDCLRLSSKEVIPNARPVADPGVDQTSTIYKYTSFDGRNSYDPEGSVLRYWWTITGAPETSDMWVSNTGTTAADASGYTNKVIGVAGDFDDVVVGDLLFIEDQKSTIKYIHSDTSYAVTVDHVFVAGSSSVYWNALKQSAWEGSWVDSTVIYVEDYTNNEPALPALNSKYLVGTVPVGPNWVAGDAGKLATWDGLVWTITAQSAGTSVYSIADTTSYRLVDTGPYDWDEGDPEPWELPHWTGRVSEIGTMLPDTSGLFTAELIVNDGTSMILPPKTHSFDGSLSSVPAEVLLNVSPTGAPLGIVPDLSFIWNYLSNFWTLVDNKDMIETVWSGAAQILSGDLLELWQHDYAKGLFDVQRLFQRRWRGYDFFYPEPNYDDEDYGATIDTTVDASGFSSDPGNNEYAYDLGAVVALSAQSGHMLVLNGQCYEISRVHNPGAPTNTTLITRDPIPQTSAARIYFTGATGSFQSGETVTGTVSTATATVTSSGWNFVIIGYPSTSFNVGETITGSVSGVTATTTGYTPPSVQRPRFWQIRPYLTSKSTDFTLQVAQMGDTAIFDVEDSDENTHTRVGCFVYGGRGSKLCFDDTTLSTYLASPSRYSVRFYGLLRRNYIPVDDSVKDISSLQEVIDVDSVEGAAAILVGNNDFIVETLTAVDSRDVQVINLLESYLDRKDSGFDGDTTSPPSGKYFDSASSDFTTSLGAVGTDLSNYLLEVGGERHRLLSVTSANRLELSSTSLTTGETNLHWRVLEGGDPPDTSWAETTYIDNNQTIEDNFGSRVDFDQDVWVQRTEDLDYLSAVQGLWYAFWNGPTLNNIQTACQVLMGLPFAESAGTVTDVRTPFNTKYNRVLVQDDGDEVIVRSYKFPVDLDVATNPTTGVAYTVGDSIAQFAPICTGVLVEDYISNPTWMSAVVGSGDMHEVQKFHTFGVTVDSNAFNYTNLIHMIGYLIRLNSESTPKVRPHYTYPMFIVKLELEDIIDVEDAMLFSPAWPPENLPLATYYQYPDTVEWRFDLQYPIAAGWTDNPANPDANRWGMLPTYDHTTRWPNDRVSYVPPRPADFGNLHVDDSTGNTPDAWSGSWPQQPISGGTHSPTVAEGTFLYGDSDENGHYIHIYGTSEVNLLSDGDMAIVTDPGGAGPPVSPWSLANYGGSSHPLTAVKALLGANRVTRITSIGPSLGIEQSGVTVVGFQASCRVLIQMISGQAHIELYDNLTQVAEWRVNGPVGSWQEITLHHWHMSTTTGTIRILTGPSGGDFYVDNAALYTNAMPWVQWAYGKMYTGRTGGYTVGGLPDEDIEITLHMTGP